MGSIKIRFAKDFEMLEERMRRMMDSFFGAWVQPHSASPTFRPAADIFENPEELVIRMDIAGVLREDLNLTLSRQELVISGRRRFPSDEPVQRFYSLEIDYGGFERRFTLPQAVEEGAIRAEYKNGVLEVRLSWKKPAPPQRIPVREA